MASHTALTHSYLHLEISYTQLSPNTLAAAPRLAINYHLIIILMASHCTHSAWERSKVDQAAPHQPTEELFG